MATYVGDVLHGLGPLGLLHLGHLGAKHRKGARIHTCGDPVLYERAVGNFIFEEELLEPRSDAREVRTRVEVEAYHVMEVIDLGELDM